MLYQLFIYPIEIIIQIVYTFFNLFFDNAGLAIAGVSLAVSILCLPLYNIAEKWEKAERNTQARMKPKIDKIKAVFNGDERYMILSAYYRQQHYHPVYALRSSISLLIQVPFFIAAYHFLSHLSVLQSTPFMGIADLGKPDALIKIGSISLNALPLVMTAINIAAGQVYARGSPKSDKIKLYGMALLFLVLLYTSSSGLVFYWTVNNVFSFLKHIVKKLKHPGRIFYAGAVAAVTSAAVYIAFFTDKTLLKKTAVSLMAVLIASIPLFVFFVRRFLYPHLHVLEKKPKDRLYLFLSLSLGFFLVGGIFIPSALVATSAQEFSFIDSYTNPAALLAFPLLHSAGFFLFWGIVLYLLFADKTKSLFTYAFALFFFCALVHTFILTGNYGDMLANLHFDTSIPETPAACVVCTDIAVFLFCAVSVLLLLKYVQPKIMLSAIMLLNISAAVLGVSNTIAIQTTYKAYKRIVQEQNLNIKADSIQPVFHLSKTKRNVVVLMLDRAISSFVPLIFNELPETAAQFKGFTRYPNTVAFNGHTMMGSPPLYGGYEYTPEKINEREHEALVKKHNEALCVMPRLFAEHGFSSTITDASWANYSWVPDNRIFWQYEGIDAKNLNGMYTSVWAKQHGITIFPHSKILKRNFIFFSFFRMLAPSLRGALYDDGDWWNPELRNSETNKILGLYSALDYLPELTCADSDKNTFSCIVNELTHESVFFQYPQYRPANTITDTGTNQFDNEILHQIYHVNAAALKLVGQWFDYLQNNGVYDNTRIIIVSDHGTEQIFPAFKHFPQMGDLYPAHANALLMVKDFNADFSLKTDMTFMTTADVPFLAAKGVIETPANPFTGTVLSDDGKKQGIRYHLTHRYTPEHHKKNTFILDNEVWQIKDNIFSPENWRQVK